MRKTTQSGDMYQLNKIQPILEIVDVKEIKSMNYGLENQVG